ncbi:MAG: hypothetical protein LBE08_00635 [Bifidobacteriaceae bacterium]|nr:hypothetical protein [Bifidobacteriaceae bacterium]
MSNEGRALYGMCYAGLGTSSSLGGLIGWNSSTQEAIVLDSVAIGGGAGVEAKESYIVLSRDLDAGGLGFGSGFRLPPVLEGNDAGGSVDKYQMELWERRVPLNGAEIAPSESFNLIVGVVPVTGAGDSSEWLEVRYHIGSRRYASYPGIGAEFLGPDECD